MRALFQITGISHVDNDKLNLDKWIPEEYEKIIYETYFQYHPIQHR